MRKLLLVLAFTGTAALIHQTVSADHHHSLSGADWSRAPNGIHDARIGTLSDNTAYRDFSGYGNGAGSTDRYLIDSGYARGSDGNVQGRGSNMQGRGSNAQGRGSTHGSSSHGNGNMQRTRAGHGGGGRR